MNNNDEYWWNEYVGCGEGFGVGFGVGCEINKKI